MQEKSNKQLEIMAKDAAFYSSDRRYEALIELERRDALSDEMQRLKKRFETSKESAEKDSEYYFAKNNPYITDDSEAPLLYTKKTIQIFSAIFSTLFGSIMLAININKYAKNKIISTLIVIIGLSFVVLLSWISNYVDLSSGLTIAINGLLGVLITELFWNKYIGKIKYRKKSIVVPLIIGLGFTAIILISIFVSK